MTSFVRLFFVMALALASAAAGYLLGRPDERAVQARKVEMIRAVTAQAGTGQLLVVGDSIVEMQPLPPMCGRVALNAGVSGARARDLGWLAAHAIEAAMPSRVVFAVGVNDLHPGLNVTLDEWTRDITALVATWRGKPILVGITTVPGRDAAMTARMNAALRALAKERGGVFVDGLAPRATYDAIHPTLAGAAAWQARIAAGCNAISGP